MFSFELAFSRSFWWNSVRNCRVKGWTLKTQRKIEPVTSSRVQRGRLCGVDFWLGNKATVSKKSRQINTVFPWKFELRLVWSWYRAEIFKKTVQYVLKNQLQKVRNKKFFSREIVVVQKALLPWLLQLSRNCCCLVCQKKIRQFADVFLTENERI